MFSRICIAWPCQKWSHCVNIERNAWMISQYWFICVDVYIITITYIANYPDFLSLNWIFKQVVWFSLWFVTILAWFDSNHYLNQYWLQTSSIPLKLLWKPNQWKQCYCQKHHPEQIDVNVETMRNVISNKQILHKNIHQYINNSNWLM